MLNPVPSFSVAGAFSGARVARPPYFPFPNVVPMLPSDKKESDTMEKPEQNETVQSAVNPDAMESLARQLREAAKKLETEATEVRAKGIGFDVDDFLQDFTWRVRHNAVSCNYWTLYGKPLSEEGDRLIRALDGGGRVRVRKKLEKMVLDRFPQIHRVSASEGPFRILVDKDNIGWLLRQDLRITNLDEVQKQLEKDCKEIFEHYHQLRKYADICKVLTVR